MSKRKVNEFNYELTKENQEIVKRKLMYVRNQIINLLKKYKKQELIKSIYIPRDINMIVGSSHPFARGKKTDFQKELDILIKTKRDLKDSIKKINLFY